jgi:Asp-tRNA(Asn)/Glu-tRNA(Gln) amidotransferase A subunit family amidase
MAAHAPWAVAASVILPTIARVRLPMMTGVVAAALAAAGTAQAQGPAQRGAGQRAEPAAITDPTTLTAQESARAFCAGRISSERMVRASLDRIQGHRSLNAFIHVDEQGALAAARDADARRKDGKGACAALAGVPIVVKDNIHVRGLPLTAGTPALKAFVPREDAPVVASLRAAGAIILGKTHLHELAFGITGYNPSFRTSDVVGVRNAYDTARVAGGSSSGTAAALAARLAPAGLGTDTGGSVRIPCAFNGCAALRPSVGRYARDGITPISHTRDTAGPMARTVADVALLDRLIVGGEPVRPAVLKGIRLGVVPALHAGLDADTRAVTEEALAKLRKAGATLVDVEMPGLLERNAAVGFPVALHEAHDDLIGYLARYDTGIDLRGLARGILSPDVKAVFDNFVVPRKLPTPTGGVVDSQPAYTAAMTTERPALQKLYRDTFARHRLDALVFPTVPAVAPVASPEVNDPATFAAVIRNTDPGSNAGIPGLQVPAGLGPKSRLPVGLEFDGPMGTDRRLLAIGLAAERVLGSLPAPPR